MSSMNLLVVIPAFNAAATLPELCGRIHTVVSQAAVMIVDDGSSDTTAEIARDLGVELLTHPVNRGKGEALRTGFAVARRRVLDAVIQLDADLQHEPECIPDLIDAFASGQGDVIIGTRDFGGGEMPWPRRMSNRMTSWVISGITHQPVADSQCGFRLIGHNVLQRVMPRSGDFAFESEFLVLAARAGFTISGVPVSTVYRGEPSSIRPWHDTARFIGVMSSLLWEDVSGRRVQEGHIS